MEYTENEIQIAIKAHNCSREEAITLYCAQIREVRSQQFNEYQAQLYKKKRKEEYPPIEDYIDGVVKGDQAQIQLYIDECLAVKLKYPKPE